jgi:DNA-binding HxlR family transcriptional regulator
MSDLDERHCAIIKPIKLVGDPWVLLIIKCLLEGPKRFNQISKEIGEITNRSLSLKLKYLSSQGVLERRVEAEQNPPQVSYYLTPLGRGVEPVLKAVEKFGDKFFCE